jgi:GAF domain-containing protein
VGDNSPADTEARLLALEGEGTVNGLLGATGRLLVDALESTACAISRVIGDLLVTLVEYSTGPSLQSGHGYLISDYPATREVLQVREPMAISVTDGDADPQEVALLRELGLDSLLMLPLVSRDDVWGLVEVYDLRPDRFVEADVETAKGIVERAATLLDRLSSN